MITDIVLDNFKGFRHVEIAPKRITAFVGPNGTGKSSVLQAFGLLKQTVQELDLAPFEVHSDISQTMLFKGPLVNLSDTDSLTATFGEGKPEISFTEMYFSGTCTLSSGEHPYRCTADFSLNDIVFLKDADAASSGFVPSLEELKTIRMVPAIRGFSAPLHQLKDNPVEDVSLTNGVMEQAEQTATNLCYSHEQVERISSLLKKVTGTGLRADIVPSKSVEVKSLNQAGAFNIVAEGFGTNSLIMLLLQLVATRPGATVMIEEPEIHLHPKAQADLAEVMVEEALAGKKQVIMTTHSESILGRLLTLVAEKKLPPRTWQSTPLRKTGRPAYARPSPCKSARTAASRAGFGISLTPTWRR